MTDLYEYVNPKNGKHSPLISKEIYEIIMTNADVSDTYFICPLEDPKNAVLDTTWGPRPRVVLKAEVLAFSNTDPTRLANSIPFFSRIQVELLENPDIFRMLSHHNSPYTKQFLARRL